MIESMMRFAARHDWGQSARVVDGGVSVTGSVRLADGSLVTETVTVRSMAELRDWAGY